MKLRDRTEIQDVLDYIRDNTNIERVLVFAANNGKNVHKFGFQMYTSVKYWSYNAPFTDQFKQYNDILADGAYVKMIQQVYDNGMTAFFVDQMPDGLLREIYMKEGVRWSGIYAIGEDKIDNVFYYLSIATSEEKSPYQRQQGVVIELNVNKLRNIFKRMHHTPIRRIREKLYI